MVRARPRNVTLAGRRRERDLTPHRPRVAKEGRGLRIKARLRGMRRGGRGARKEEKGRGAGGGLQRERRRASRPFGPLTLRSSASRGVRRVPQTPANLRTRAPPAEEARSRAPAGPRVPTALEQSAAPLRARRDFPCPAGVSLQRPSRRGLSHILDPGRVPPPPPPPLSTESRRRSEPAGRLGGFGEGIPKRKG